MNNLIASAMYAALAGFWLPWIVSSWAQQLMHHNYTLPYPTAFIAAFVVAFMSDKLAQCACGAGMLSFVLILAGVLPAPL